MKHPFDFSDEARVLMNDRIDALEEQLIQAEELMKIYSDALSKITGVAGSVSFLESSVSILLEKLLECREIAIEAQKTQEDGR